MYAVIKNGGKQYKVSTGDVLYLEKMDFEAEDTVVFDEVVFLSNEGKAVVGTPNVKGAKVTGKVIKNGRGKKLVIFRYRPKKHSKRKMGHRQSYTKVEITSIEA